MKSEREASLTQFLPWLHSLLEKAGPQASHFLSRSKIWLESKCFPFTLACVVFLLTLPALHGGMVADDYRQRAAFIPPPTLELQQPSWEPFAFTGGDASDLITQRANGYPWWAQDDYKIFFWRPVTALTHGLDYFLWPDAPWLMHLQSILWYCGVVVLAALLFRRFIKPIWAAGLASFIYAMDGSHVVPIIWISNRNALLSVAFGLLTLLLHDRWRRDRVATGAILAPFFLILGLLSNEGAIASCAYLFAYALFIDKGKFLKRMFTLVPYALVVVIWRVYYSLHGYGASGSDAYIDPISSPFRFLKAVLVREPVLLLGQWAFPPADIFIVMPDWAKIALWIAAMSFCILLAILMSRLFMRHAVTRFWFVGMVLSLIPSCATIPSNRCLMYAGIGATGLLVQFLVAYQNKELMLPKHSIRLASARVLFYTFIVIHVALAPLILFAELAIGSTLMARLDVPAKALAATESAAGKKLIIVDDPLGCYRGATVSLLRAIQGRPPVAGVCSIASISAELSPIELYREDEQTLIVKPAQSYEWLLFRDSKHPFHVGDKVQATFYSVEVLEVTEKGIPTKVAFQFDVPLEDESMYWMEYEGASMVPWDGHWVEFSPPQVGEMIWVNAPVE